MGLRFAYLISPLLFTDHTPDFHCNALHFFGWAGGRTHFGFIKIKKSGTSLLAFCPYRGLVGESPPRTTDLSKMCHFASLKVRLMRIKNLSALGNSCRLRVNFRITFGRKIIRQNIYETLRSPKYLPRLFRFFLCSVLL